MRYRGVGVLALIAGGALSGCQAGSGGAATAAAQTQAPAAQIFSGLGDHHRKATTGSPEAQKYFDQGLTWAYAFNHDEAIRSFTEAARLDPKCAMAQWGIALCNGPHINNPAMDEDHSKAAWAALQKAKSLATNATLEEKALIWALSSRYADPAAGKPPLDPVERHPLDQAYADAMGKVHEQFAADNDIATLAAESLMDLRPWDLWTLDGTPRPETPQIVGLLEGVLSRDPRHPGANHLYIHAVEASLHPDHAVPAADRLGALVPAAGHLVHMPAHIYARVGRWEDAAESNRRAIAADKVYRARSPNQGFYHIYMAHNHQFLAWGCMMQGRKAEALAEARQMVSEIPTEFIQAAAPAIDGFLPLPRAVLMRFGEWEELLKEPEPAEILPMSRAMWRYTRAIALSNLGRREEAERERKEFQTAAARVPKEWKVGNTDASIILTIAGHVLDGEIAFRAGHNDEAVTHLREAVKAEDTVRYDEPPDWLQPTRHTLGAFLLAAGHVEEAERVYRDDLKRWPENGWDLYGLVQCATARKSGDLNDLERRYAAAWSKADTKIHATCLCVPKSEH